MRQHLTGYNISQHWILNTRSHRTDNADIIIFSRLVFTGKHQLLSAYYLILWNMYSMIKDWRFFLTSHIWSLLCTIYTVSTMWNFNIACCIFRHIKVLQIISTHVELYVCFFYMTAGNKTLQWLLGCSSKSLIWSLKCLYLVFSRQYDWVSCIMQCKYDVQVLHITFNLHLAEVCFERAYCFIDRIRQVLL